MSREPARKLDYVDALRAWAILLVVLVHTSQYIPNLPDAATLLADNGRFGVQLFFLTSALTMGLSWESRAGEIRPVASFLIRRLCRIAPMYWLGIVVYLSITLGFGLLTGDMQKFSENYRPLPVALNFLFLHGLWPDGNNSVVPGGWSIGCEMLFYLMVPGLMAMIRSARVAIGLAVASIAGYLAVRYGLALAGLINFTFPIDSFDYYLIANQMPVFLTGFGLFHVLKRGPSRPPAWVGWSLFSLAGLGTVLWLYRSGYVGMAGPAAVAVAFFGLALALSWRQHFPPVLLEIGRRSFSIYVLHFLFAWYIVPRLVKLVPGVVLYPVLNLVLSLVLVIGATYLAAGLTFRWIEKPGIDFGKRWVAGVQAKVSGTS